MKVLLYEAHALNHGPIIPKGAVAHFSERKALAIIRAGKGRRLPDDTRARKTPYEDNFCVPPNRTAAKPK